MIFGFEARNSLKWASRAMLVPFDMRSSACNRRFQTCSLRHLIIQLAVPLLVQILQSTRSDLGRGSKFEWQEVDRLFQ